MTAHLDVDFVYDSISEGYRTSREIAEHFLEVSGLPEEKYSVIRSRVTNKVMHLAHQGRIKCLGYTKVVPMSRAMGIWEVVE